MRLQKCNLFSFSWIAYGRGPWPHIPVRASHSWCQCQHCDQISRRESVWPSQHCLQTILVPFVNRGVHSPDQSQVKPTIYLHSVSYRHKTPGVTLLESHLEISYQSLPERLHREGPLSDQIQGSSLSGVVTTDLRSHRSLLIVDYSESTSRSFWINSWYT